MHWACLQNNTNLAKKLITLGAKVNAKDEQGNTALMHAYAHNNAEMVEFLLNNGATIGNKLLKLVETFILNDSAQCIIVKNIMDEMLIEVELTGCLDEEELYDEASLDPYE